MERICNAPLKFVIHPLKNLYSRRDVIAEYRYVCWSLVTAVYCKCWYCTDIYISRECSTSELLTPKLVDMSCIDPEVESHRLRLGWVGDVDLHLSMTEHIFVVCRKFADTDILAGGANGISRDTDVTYQ